MCDFHPLTRRCRSLVEDEYVLNILRMRADTLQASDRAVAGVCPNVTKRRQPTKARAQ